jgi:hypothetical protein
MTRNYELLRQYFVAVAKDVAARSKQKKGQPVKQVIKSEYQQVLSDVEEDLKQVLAEMGFSLAASTVQFVERAMQDKVSQLVGQGTYVITDLIFQSIGNKAREAKNK